MKVEDFLELFPGRHVYCTVDDKRRNQALIHYHEGADKTRGELLEELESVNASTDRGVFFCVNEIHRELDPGRQRTKKALHRLRAVFCDDDQKRESARVDWPVQPNLVVATSQGKYHYYWLLKDSPDLTEWVEVQKAIVANFGGDPQAYDATRVLRLPGYRHLKGDPFIVTAEAVGGVMHSWQAIREAFPYDEKDIESSGKQINFSCYAQAQEAIRTGSQYHGAIMFLLNHWVNHGIKDPDELQFLIRSTLDIADNKDSRWQQRCELDYLKANIKDCLNFVERNPINETIDVATVDNHGKQIDIGFPPGEMGKLCQEIQDSSNYPNPEISTAAAFSLVAGIVGRSYNVLGDGLNLYITVLADSGIGKSVIKNTINTLLLENCVLQGGALFIGPSRVTGPKALFDTLARGMSRVCVFEEAGLLEASDAGDMAGLNRVLLDIFTSSGMGQYAGGEAYSNKKDSIPTLPNPSLSIVNISTPSRYLAALQAKGAVGSGDLARMWVMRTLRSKPGINRSKLGNFSSETIKRVQSLVSNSISHQHFYDSNQERVEQKTPTAIEIPCVDIYDEADYWGGLENKHKEAGDELRRTMCSRAAMKVLKLASIVAVYNGSHKVSLDEFKWAKNAIYQEIEMIDNTVAEGASNGLFDLFKFTVGPVVTRVINCEFKDKKQQPPKNMQGKGVFTRYALDRASRHLEVVKSFDDDKTKSSPRSGVDKIIEFMTANNYCTTVSKDELRGWGCKNIKNAYRVTDLFKLEMETK